jgi:hypothetical protein
MASGSALVVHISGIRCALSVRIHLECIAGPIFLANVRGKDKAGRQLRRSFQRNDALRVVDLGLLFLGRRLL